MKIKTGVLWLADLDPIDNPDKWVIDNATSGNNTPRYARGEVVFDAPFPGTPEVVLGLAGLSIKPRALNLTLSGNPQTVSAHIDANHVMLTVESRTTAGFKFRVSSYDTCQVLGVRVSWIAIYPDSDSVGTGTGGLINP